METINGYTYIERVVDEYTNSDGDYDNSELMYSGKIYKNKEEKTVMIKCDEGRSEILYFLFMTGQTNIDRIDEEETFFYKEQEAIAPTGEDYKKIANIYKFLMRVGILMESCEFVRGENGGVLLQLPRGLIMYTMKDKEKVARHNYLYSDCIDLSMLKREMGDEVMKLIFTEEEMKKRMED